MKSRLALTALIVVGAMMSGTGATLAISGSSSSDNAPEAEYTTPETTTTETTTTETKSTPTTESTPPPTLTPAPVLGQQEDETDSPPPEDVQDVAGEQEEGGAPTDDSQPTEQVAAAGDASDSLPFTGFIAIPLLIGGVALAATGGILRHRTRDNE